MSVVTKTGDKGETSLVGGERVLKNHERVSAYGSIDELNSFVGVTICELDEKLFQNEIKLLTWLQNKLFDLGSSVATLPEDRLKYKIKNIDELNIDELEKQITSIEAQLPKLQEFILPGGTKESAHFHVCRTVTRRVERDLVNLYQHSSDSQVMIAIKFINRLSDYFFVAARYSNFLNKKSDVTWKK